MMLDWLAGKRLVNNLAGMAADIRFAVERAIDDLETRTRDLGGAAGTRACSAAVIADLKGPGPD
jgi:isocitrate/isopropylmalate dehydrogenase